MLHWLPSKPFTSSTDISGTCKLQLSRQSRTRWRAQMAVPLHMFQDQETRELAVSIARDILTRNPKVQRITDF